MIVEQYRQQAKLDGGEMDLFFAAGTGSSVQLLLPRAFTCNPLPLSNC
jgi:hypothetical protein